MFDFESVRSDINALCARLRIAELSFFGSAVRDDFDAESDVDALVSFQGDDRLFDRYFDCKEGLESILGRSVDLVMREAMRNPIIQRRVREEKMRFYAA